MSTTVREAFTPGANTLADAWGRHVVTGALLLVDMDASAVLHVLGEGEWVECERAWYAGEELDVGTECLFQPGALDQDAPTFFADALHYAGTAYAEAQITAGPEVTDEPGRLKLICKTKPGWALDGDGNVSRPDEVANPACVAAEIIGDPTLIDYASWSQWRDYCNAEVSWDWNDQTYTAPRFEAHLAFPSPTPRRAALDAVALVSCTQIAFTGARYVFFPPCPTRQAVHVFEYPLNVLSYSLQRTPLQQKPSYLRARFRDAQDEFLDETTWIWINPDIVAQRDVIETPPEIRFSTMSRSQVSRVLGYQGRLKSQCDLTVTLRALGDGFHVCVGDVVYVRLPDEGVAAHFFVVQAVDDALCTRRFALQLYDPWIYRDAFESPNDGQALLRPPTGLTATLAGPEVTLTWTAAAGAEGVQVARDGVVTATLAGDATTYVWTAPGGGVFTFRVRHTYAGGAGAWSNEVVVAVGDGGAGWGGGYDDPPDGRGGWPGWVVGFS